MGIPVHKQNLETGELNPDGTPILVYLAEPIDQTSRNTARGATDLYSTLEYAGYTVFRPRTGFRASRLDARIEQINRHALYRADCIVAYLPMGVASIGVPAEIEAATARGIPAIVLTAVQSQALAGNPLVTVVDKPSLITTAIQEVVQQRRGGPQTPTIQMVLRSGFSSMPGRAYEDDAGLDLPTASAVTIDPGYFADVETEVEAIQLPEGYWGAIVGRSSTLRKYGLMVPFSVIDPGWRGPLYVGAWNLTDNPVTIQPGDRLGQLIAIPVALLPAIAVDTVEPHKRGTNGFGSSGR